MTDEGLTQLAGLKNLESLDLTGTAVTDAGLAQLTALKQLRELNLEDTPVTDIGVKRLQTALPNLKIHR